MDYFEFCKKMKNKHLDYNETIVYKKYNEFLESTKENKDILKKLTSLHDLRSEFFYCIYSCVSWDKFKYYDVNAWIKNYIDFLIKEDWWKADEIITSEEVDLAKAYELYYRTINEEAKALLEPYIVAYKLSKE